MQEPTSDRQGEIRAGGVLLQHRQTVLNITFEQYLRFEQRVLVQLTRKLLPKINEFIRRSKFYKILLVPTARVKSLHNVGRMPLLVGLELRGLVASEPTDTKSLTSMLDCTVSCGTFRSRFCELITKTARLNSRSALSGKLVVDDVKSRLPAQVDRLLDW